MDEIRRWLDSKRPYDAGVKLYMQYGQDPLHLLLFQEEYTEFKRVRLIELLEGLCLASPEPPTEPVLAGGISEVVMVNIEDVEEFKQLQNDHEDLLEEKEELEIQVETLEEEKQGLQDENQKLKSERKNAPRGWPAAMDETIKALHDQWHPLFVEKKNIQARIYDIALAGQSDPEKKKEAGAMAHKILDLRDQCKRIYAQRDHYIKYHKLPEEKKPIGIPDDPMKWPVTLQNFQRYVRDYKNKLLKQPHNEAFQKQLEKYQWGVAELKKIMKLD